MSTLAALKNLEIIDLFLSAKGLPLHFHTLSVTTAYAVMYEIERKTGALRKIGHTNVINDLNPTWATCFAVQYLFEVKQEYVIKIFHAENANLDNESAQRYIGEVHFDLANLLGSHSPSMSFPVTNAKEASSRSLGDVTVRPEVRADCHDLLCVTFSATNLANKEGFFAKSDPFLVIKRSNEDNTFTKVWESSVVMDNLNPCWAATKLPISLICNGDHFRPFKIEVYDFEKSGKHEFMGEVSELSINRMMTGQSGSLKEYRADVIEPEQKRKKASYKNSGTLLMRGLEIERHYTFSQYIKAGLEINLMVAVDFTGSNGDSQLPDSLHYVHPAHTVMNQYEQSILSIGKILEAYDKDHLYPVFGFGARVRDPDGSYPATANHCFNLAKEGFDEVRGVEGILKAYHRALPNLLLAGPTLFTPFLQTVGYTVESDVANRPAKVGSGVDTKVTGKYTLALILTDGVINDMESTIGTLINMSNEPISVIIVGVGSADFRDMKKLDSDSGLLTQGSKSAVRDVVQFVPFHETLQDGSSVLAQQVLAEIPGQVRAYMEASGITPHRP